LSASPPFATVPPDPEGAPSAYGGPRTIPWWLRGILVIGGAILATLLFTAFMLAPERRGFGTHRQLGLPPCTLVQTIGMRCPSCGMTTSWACLTKGQVFKAFAMNAGGALFGIYSIFLAPYFLGSGLSGRWIWRRPNEWVVLFIGVTVMGTTLIDWTFRVLLR
jgi:hypothetical protein